MKKDRHAPLREREPRGAAVAELLLLLLLLLPVVAELVKGREQQQEQKWQVVELPVEERVLAQSVPMQRLQGRRPRA
jgi:hypothetical protein